jgi:ketosteroid isomerase-like protein
MRWCASLAILVIVAGFAPSARAQGATPDAEVKAAFTAFVDGIAAGKELPSSVELLLGPSRDDNDATPASLASTAKLFDKPKVSFVAVVISPGGASAWVAAELPAKVPRKGKIKKESLRASAVLVKDGASWTIRAAHLSIGQKNEVPEECGALTYEWEFEDSVPPTLVAPVKDVLDALADHDPMTLVARLSDDKKALVFGSAPKEKFVGGAKIKGIFKKWEVGLVYWDHDKQPDDLPSRAGITPDGKLLWMTAATVVPSMCTSYRTLLVLAKEPAGWRIVHQHYSEPFDSAD